MSQEAGITQHRTRQKNVPPDEDVRYIEKVINFWPKSDEYWAYRHLWLEKIKKAFFIIIIAAIQRRGRKLWNYMDWSERAVE